MDNDNPFYMYPTEPLSDKDFCNLQSFIEGELGIKMPETKRIMLESRLQKRLRALKMKNYSEYLGFVFSEKGKDSELHHMIDVITTNKTDFFRESDHFDSLFNTFLPLMMKEFSFSANHPLRAWSAGCSTGEEPYTLAMILMEYRHREPAFDFSILASDISTQVLDKAVAGVYEEEKTEPVPYELKKKYLLRSKDRERKEVRIKPEVREKVKFIRLNFMDDSFSFDTKFHIIFCRNVIIYFDRSTQKVLLGKFFNHLLPGGFLFLGHSETITGMDLQFKTVAPTIYQKPWKGVD